MAGRYTKQELKVKLHRSAFHLVATESLGRLTTRKLSAGCGLSEPYIYQCYSDIPELIEDAFMSIDQEIADLMQKLIQRHSKHCLLFLYISETCLFSQHTDKYFLLYIFQLRCTYRDRFVRDGRDST